MTNNLRANFKRKINNIASSSIENPWPTPTLHHCYPMALINRFLSYEALLIVSIFAATFTWRTKKFLFQLKQFASRQFFYKCSSDQHLRGLKRKIHLKDVTITDFFSSRNFVFFGPGSVNFSDASFFWVMASNPIQDQLNVSPLKVVCYSFEANIMAAGLLF